MNKIEYEIVLNKSGRPCIGLSNQYEDKPEDKFFALELTRYILENVYARRSKQFDEETAKQINQAITLLQQIGDEIAEILWQNMKLLGDTSILFNKPYHVQVKTIEERNQLSFNGILAEDKIYLRQEGLRVLVTDEMKIYELKGGIDNENWCEITTQKN
jgi:hypothetical protein